MVVLIPETPEAIMRRDDSHDQERRPVAPPNVESAADSTLHHDWTDCAPESHKQDESTQDEEGASPLKALVCDGADPKAQETTTEDDSSDSDDSEPEFLDLDSMLPIAETLTSIMRYDPTKTPNDRSYYFEGVPTTEEMDEFEAYVKRVEAFTLTTATLQQLSFGALLRLSTIRNWQGAFFPSLKILRVDCCDYSTMQTLNLFLSSSLESLEITIGDTWDKNCEEALDSFVATLSSEAPDLTSLKIRLAEFTSGELESPIIPGYCPFEHLRTLHLEETVIREWSVLEALGELGLLEDLSLTTVLRRRYNARTPTTVDDGEWDVLADCPLEQDTFPAGFASLKRLRIAARIELLRDLFDNIESDNVTDLSITLLASSREAQTLRYVHGVNFKNTDDLSDEEIIAMIKSEGVRFTFRNEDDFFCRMLERAAKKWQELQSIIIDYRQRTNTLQRAHHLSSGTLEKLLLQPQLRRLEICDWVTDFDIGRLVASHPPTHKSNLEILHLPTNASSFITTGGIPWTVLSVINKKFPNLTSFRGYLNRHISDIPDYTASIPAEISPNFNVMTLVLGDGVISWDEDVDSDYLLRVGIYLYSLFPHLDTIIAQDNDGSSDSDWDYLRRLVKMCQASGRMANHVRS